MAHARHPELSGIAPWARVFDRAAQWLGFGAAVVGAWYGLPVIAGTGGLLAIVASGPCAWHVASAAVVAERLAVLVVCMALALAAQSTTLPWQVPAALHELLHLSRYGAVLLTALYLAWAVHGAARGDAPARVSAHLAWLLLPLLFNSLLLLSAAALLEQLGHLAVGARAPAALAQFAARALLLLAFNEVVLLGCGWLMDRRGTWNRQIHALLLFTSLLVAASPLIADFAHQPWLVSAPMVVHAVAAILLSALAQCGLWAETFLVTGILLDALRGRRPTPQASLTHWRAGLLRGAIYAGLFMALILLLAGVSRLDWLVGALRAVPPLGGLLIGALVFPLLKTLIESFDGSSPFHTRLRAAYGDPRNVLRGAIAGSGVGLAWMLGLPQMSGALRFGAGCAIGALTYAGADLIWNLREISQSRRSRVQWLRVYALGAALGAFVGGALAWYLDTTQVAAVMTKIQLYAVLDPALGPRAAEHYVVYPLFSKYGAIDLGLVSGGVKLLYAESLSGVINWSLAAPLFSVNLLLLTALVEKSWAPLRNLFSADGLATLVEQAVRVLRWGLWMAPVIYSFLRLAPDPAWYNQDGAVRTVVATVQAIVLSPADFRAWSLSVFLGLLAYDSLRVLIWLDHMGLRVATLVNLSFVGGDVLDEKAARFLGHSARTRVIPEGIRRFLTWAPLLIPFYIPRGAEWDEVWRQAETVARSADPMLPAVATLLIAYRVAAAALALWLGWLLVRRLRRPALVGSVAPAAPLVIGNGRYFVELHPDGRGYSRCESDVRPGAMLDLTRRPDDALSLCGKFVYLRELDAAGSVIGAPWSLGPEPIRYGASSVTRAAPDRLRIVRSQNGLRVDADIRVAATEPVEIWDLLIANHSDHDRVLELTTYQEFVVGPADAVRRTPAFAGLHVGTVFVRGLGALLARNRLLRAQSRSSREVGFHAAAGAAELLGYQDSRGDFLGRGSLRDPAARMESPDREGLRYSFDPCASLRLRVELPARATRRLRLVDGYARDEQLAAQRIARHLDLDPPDAAKLRRLFESARAVQMHDDESLRAWSEPWSADGRELRAPTDAQRPWTHVMANPLGHGAVLSSDGAIFAFAGNAQQNALSPFALESVSAQQPGELFLLHDLDSGESFSPSLIPLRHADARREALFGLGSARLSQRAHDLELTLDVFVDIDQPAQYRVLRVVNAGPAPRRLRLLSCIDLVLAETAQDSGGRLLTEAVATADGGAVLLLRNPRNDFVRGWVFAGSSLEGAQGHSQRSAVFGRQADRSRPHLLVHGRADAACADDGRRCAAFCAEITLAPGQAHISVTVLGQTADRDEALQLAARLRTPLAAQAAYSRVRDFWNERLGVLRIRTARPEFDRLVNDWLPYQVLVSRLWGRTGPAQRGGAFGFRDQLQDVLPFAWLDPALARRQILRHAAQQFREGDVLKWWHDSWEGRTGIGVRTRASDPHLWLPYVTVRYIEMSGDAGILDERLPFIEGDPVPAGHEGVMLAPRITTDRASLYEHCRRAIDLSLAQRGPRGLPLLGSGDWNDGLDMLGLGMVGESTWMAFFLQDVLRDFAPLAEARGAVDAARYRDEAARLRLAVETMWRADGYVRATADDGADLAYTDALTVSWAVLSGSADLERGVAVLERGLDDLERYSRVLLLGPAFDEYSQPYPGRIAEYPPGVRENGGQYSHGVSWLVDAWLRCAALAQAANANERAEHCLSRARELWFRISPIPKSTSATLPRYGLAPHQQPADVYDFPGYEGRGGWAWYTGAAARMLTTAYALVGLQAGPNGRPVCTGPVAIEAELRFRGQPVARTVPSQPEPDAATSA